MRTPQLRDVKVARGQGYRLRPQARGGDFVLEDLKGEVVKLDEFGVMSHISKKQAAHLRKTLPALELDATLGALNG